MASVYTSNIAQKLLIDPVFEGANKLCIMVHEATPTMASWLLAYYGDKDNYIENISIELMITFTEDMGMPTILEINHNGFESLHKKFRTGNNTFSCSYFYGRSIPKRNLYIWVRDGRPYKAFTCSYDFTQPSILRDGSGSISNSNPDTAYGRFLRAVDESIYCDNSEVEDFVLISQTELPVISDIDKNDKNLVTLSLVTKRTDEPGKKSGLNWGQRKGRNPNEAYIPLPKKIAESGFFPLDGKQFLVVTDDHHTILLRVEQQDDKAITTPDSNAQIGEYFRNRLGLANGVHVTRANLEAYGRTDVSFYKIDDEQYYMDFSVAGGRHRRNG